MILNQINLVKLQLIIFLIKVWNYN